MVRHDAAPTQSDNLAPCGQVDRRCRELDQEVYLEQNLVHLFNFFSILIFAFSSRNARSAKPLP